MLTLNWIPRICPTIQDLIACFKSAYWRGRFPKVPTVCASSRRIKLRIFSANCGQYMYCFVVRVAVRVFRKVVFEQHTYNGFVGNINGILHSNYIACVWLGHRYYCQSNAIGSRVRETFRGDKFIWCIRKHLCIHVINDVNIPCYEQEQLTYTVSDEGKWEECEICNSLCHCIIFDKKFLKRRDRTPQNPTLNVGRDGKYERMITFPAVTYIKPMGRVSTIANRKANISFVTPVLPQIIRPFTMNRFLCNFIFWTSIKTLRFWVKLTNLKGPTIKTYIHSNVFYVFSTVMTPVYSVSLYSIYQIW
jgi:hypothetical protein